MFAGERSLRQILEDALRIADRCVDQRDREGIIKSVNDITSMIDALAELRAQGKVRYGHLIDPSLTNTISKVKYKHRFQHAIVL